MIGAAKTRDESGKLGRALSVLRNYGMLSSSRFEARLGSFRRFLQSRNIHATFACPSSLLGRGQAIVDFLKVFDVAIHGMDHVDYKRMSPQRVESDVQQAISDFGSCSLNPMGFRAPYLRWSTDLIKVLAKSSLIYDSSNSVFWDVAGDDIPSQGGVRKLLEFYSSVNEYETPSLPRLEDGIVRIPVSLPDDEILLERLRMNRPSDLFACWRRMLMESYEKSELLVLQIHPERFDECKIALGRLLKEIKKRNIWVATLSDIASWWLARNEVNLTIDAQMRVDCKDIDRITITSGSETKEPGEKVPSQMLLHISPNHPLYERALELGFVISSSGYTIRPDLVREADLLEIARKERLLQKSLWPNDFQSAFCLTGDIDALSVRDFIRRLSGRGWGGFGRCL